MIKWHEPFKISEWLKRTFSFLNMAMFIIVAALLFSELRFDWCEQLTGSYLASGNKERPEIGTVWKAGQSSSRAHTHLKNIISDRQNTARYASEASSFAELASGILPGQWTNLDKEHFKKLYLDLPNSYARELIQPTELIWLFGTSDLNRIFCKSTSKGIIVYFLDAKNRVIKKISLNNNRLAFLEKQELPFKGNLEEIPGFKNRIFPAKLFFKVLLELPEDIGEELIINPAKLIKQKGKIVRAGIWDEAESGYIKMGFEFNNNGEKTIVFVKGREWAVWRLSLGLTGVK